MGKYIARLIGSVCLIISISGCVTTNATMVGPARTRASISPYDVVIYRTPAQVPGQYEEVALLHSKGDSYMTDEPKMYTSMKQKAAELGANGILLDAISEPSAGAKIAGAFLGYSAERQGKAVAIYVYGQDQQPFVGITPSAPAVQSFAPAAPPPRPVAQQRGDPLQELDTLWQQGRITPEEYWRRRDAIIPPEQPVPPPRPAAVPAYREPVPLATEVIVPSVAPVQRSYQVPSQGSSLLSDYNAGRISLEEYRLRRDAGE